MPKTILITGATDGIGLETAKMLVEQGHHVLLHGRNPDKLKTVQAQLTALGEGQEPEPYVADLSAMREVEDLAKAIATKNPKLDVLINNAGVYSTSKPITHDGLDVRFVVNAIAPYLLTQRLLPLMSSSGRVVNLSSAAQSTVNLAALKGEARLTDSAAYAQSKLALTMWSCSLGLALKDRGLVVVAVNPGSLLGSKMVKQAYGMEGGDLGIGAKILTRAALSEEFADAYGRYFDNDSGRFAAPHPDALNEQNNQQVISMIEKILAN